MINCKLWLVCYKLAVSFLNKKQYNIDTTIKIIKKIKKGKIVKNLVNINNKLVYMVEKQALPGFLGVNILLLEKQNWANCS